MFANQRFFDAPEALLIASGQASYGGADIVRLNTGILGPDSTVAAIVSNGGIESPRRHEIPHNTRMVRFGRNIITELVMQGDWWLEEKEYGRVWAYAEQHGLGIGAALRLLCAVPSEWSTLDLMVQVVTVGPLLAYRGPGNAAISLASQGQPAVPGRNDTGLVDKAGKPISDVIGARPPRLGQAPAYARSEYVPVTATSDGLRVQQLFIPGLGSGDVRRDSILFQGRRFLDRGETDRGYVPRMV